MHSVHNRLTNKSYTTEIAKLRRRLDNAIDINSGKAIKRCYKDMQRQIDRAVRFGIDDSVMKRLTYHVDEEVEFIRMLEEQNKRQAERWKEEPEELIQSISYISASTIIICTFIYILTQG
jgi:hypothetical protein